MDCDTYEVVQLEGGWSIVLNGQVIQSGMDQQHAVRAAATAARMSGSRGRQAAVVLPSEAGAETGAAAGLNASRGGEE